MRYNAAISQAVHTIPIPVEGFKMDVVDFDTFVLLRFYYSQWNHFSEPERQKLLNYLDKVKRTIQAYGLAAALDPVMDVKNVTL